MRSKELQSGQKNPRIRKHAKVTYHQAFPKSDGLYPDFQQSGVSASFSQWISFFSGKLRQASSNQVGSVMAH